MEGPDSSLDGVDIKVSKETNEVTGIEVSYRPKTLN